MMRSVYLFRVDDLCPTQQNEKWLHLKLSFERLSIRPLLAVIPDCRDPDLGFEPPHLEFWSELRAARANGWTIAQHGHQHVYRPKQGGLLALNEYGEFPGLSYEEQREKIAQGRSVLASQGLGTEVFVAPAHSFDHATLRALVDCGFRYLSDGIGLFPFWQEGLLWVPQAWWEPVVLPIGIHTICLHPQSMTDERFQKLESFIVAHRDQIVDFDWVIEWSRAQPAPARIACGALNALFRRFWWWNRRRYQ